MSTPDISALLKGTVPEFSGDDRPEKPGLSPVFAGARKPHICFVAPTTWPIFSHATDIPVVGGAEVQQSLLAPELARRGYRVSMITLDYGQPQDAVIEGVRVRKMYRPDEGIRVLRFIHPRLTGLWRALKAVDADVYYQRTAAALTGFVAEFCRRHGKRSIYSGASDVDFMPGQEDIAFPRDRVLFRHGVRRVDRVFVQNPTQLELVRRNFAREAVLIPNCYAAPAGARADREGCVLWVATVRAQKRPEIALELARRLPQYRFVLVGGSDPDREGRAFAAEIRALASRLPNVEYRGFVPFREADRLFDGARVLINTSSYEGFPNTFLQAWARGVPTVSFVDTGSRDEGGRCVYPIAADIEEAARHVERLMRDEREWEEASARCARHFAAAHSIGAVVDLFEAEIARLVAAREAGAAVQA